MHKIPGTATTYLLLKGVSIMENFKVTSVQSKVYSAIFINDHPYLSMSI